MSALSTFFKMNRTLCKKIEPYLPQAKTNIWVLYEMEVARRMNSEPEQVVVDVGGGKSCPFARRKDPAMKPKIIAVDISEEELRHNCDVDEKRVADITRGLPVGIGEVDLIVSKSVLEHLEHLEGFVSNTKEALRSGGYSIHLFPSKFAPFALINQALPKRLSRRLVYYFLPESKGICGFPAFYDNCYYSAMNALLQKHGYEIVKTHLGYYQSPYFGFFFPLFIVSVLYEILMHTFGAKNLCAYVLVVARKL